MAEAPADLPPLDWQDALPEDAAQPEDDFDADSQFWRSSSIGDLVSLNFPRYVNEDVDATVARLERPVSLGARATT